MLHIIDHLSTHMSIRGAAVYLMDHSMLTNGLRQQLFLVSLFPCVLTAPLDALQASNIACDSTLHNPWRRSSFECMALLHGTLWCPVLPNFVSRVSCQPSSLAVRLTVPQVCAARQSMLPHQPHIWLDCTTCIRRGQGTNMQISTACSRLGFPFCGLIIVSPSHVATTFKGRRLLLTAHVAGAFQPPMG